MERKNDEMVPEYVHHYQYTDDIKIYENIFIGMLINLIRLELNKYSEFYASLIPSVESNNDKYLENKIAEKMITKIEALQRKQMFIQNTSFYKEISKCNLHLTKVLPTNILLKIVYTIIVINFIFNLLKVKMKIDYLKNLLSIINM